jgi:hypothetical protein
MNATRERQREEKEPTSQILEEFKLFIDDCTTCLLLNQEHHIVTLLERYLILLNLHLSFHKVLKGFFRILIHGSKN